MPITHGDGFMNWFSSRFAEALSYRDRFASVAFVSVDSRAAPGNAAPGRLRDIVGRGGPAHAGIIQVILDEYQTESSCENLCLTVLFASSRGKQERSRHGST
jgi:hypothetical protein